MTAAAKLSRPIFLTREGSQLRLACAYDPDLNERLRQLPYCTFNPQSRSWLVDITDAAVNELRHMYFEGLCDVAVDSLLADGEEVPRCVPAVLSGGSRARPFVVRTAGRDEQLYAKLRSVAGASWSKDVRALTYPGTAAAALVELVERGVVADPEQLLRPAETTVAFDPRTGRFKVLGDSRAQEAFERHFPARDVVAGWESRGLEVGFADELACEVYRSELARGTHLHPVGLHGTLRGYQAESVAMAVTRTGFCVFHSPGLGKTPIAVAAGLHLLNEGEVPRVVVVCPGAVKSQFAEEIERFSGHDDIVVVGGTKPKRVAQYEAAATSRWMVLNYDLLWRDLASLRPLSAGSYLIADEVHRCKSGAAKRTKALHQLGRVAARRLAMTGTPVESVPDEWFWVLEFAVPGVFGRFADFAASHMFASRWGGWEGAQRLPELHTKSVPHYIRYTKAEVLADLPPLTVTHVPLEPDAKHRSALRRAHREARDVIAAERKARATRSVRGGGGALDSDALDEIEAGSEMTAVGMLRAMCTSPRLVFDSDSPAARALVEADAVPNVDGPKLDWLREAVTGWQCAGERVVIFTYSKKMANLIAQRFVEDGVRHVLYTGDTPAALREQARRRFNDPADDVCAFVATDAGAEGLNLGRCCTRLVNVDIPWTPSRLEQRSNRIHRADSTGDRFDVINLTIRGTLEDGILRLVESKAELSDTLLGERGTRTRTTGRRRVPSGAAVLEQALDEYFDPHPNRAAGTRPEPAPPEMPAAPAQAQTSPAAGGGAVTVLRRRIRTSSGESPF